jgi:glutathione synthase/RimK-type ligase-like ATP-grasp enzyme
MSKKQVLIVTSRDDAHADHVIRKLNSQGLSNRVVRINTEDFPDNCRGSFDGSVFALRIKDSGKELRSSEIGSVWFRRPKTFSFSQHADDYTKAYLDKQWTAFLRGLYFSTHDSATWVNSLAALHRARNKLQQIEVANRLNIKMPRTLVSNDDREIMSFVHEVGGLITKSLDEPSVLIDGHIFPMFTRRVSEGEIEQNLDAFEVCPVLLQQEIVKRADVRVLVFGNQIFAVEMVAKQTNNQAVDIRENMPDDLIFRQVQLPKTISLMVSAFVRHQGLLFSALDFVVDVEGEFYFLENNANGQWLWLERYSGAPLTDALLSLLLE